MEMVDLVFINKVEEDNKVKAKKTKLELLHALHFMPEKEKGWKVPVLLGSALHHTGLQEMYEKIDEFIGLKVKNNRFDEVRQAQAKKRFEYWVKEYILEMADQKSEGDSFSEHKKKASDLEVNPSSEARLFVEKLLGKI